jgi:hypothetical protein
MTLTILVCCCRTFAQDSLQEFDPAGYEPVIILSPLPDSTLAPDDPLEISLLLSGLEGLQLRIRLDGADITAGAEISRDYLYYTSGLPLSPGRHQIELWAGNMTDTVLSRSWVFHSPPSAETQTRDRIPYEFSAGLGWMLSDCNADTSGLGLSTPTGSLPSAEITGSGQLGGGFFTGFVSYDPVYDRDAHGLMQYSGQVFDLSLGEFYPELNELAFSGLSPLGALAFYRNSAFSLSLMGCRSQPADTGYKTFAQYIYGADLGLKLKKGALFSGGYFIGHDQPGSLPDSVRFATTEYVFTDDLLGITDTLISTDTLHPGRNRVAVFSLKWPLGLLEVKADYAGTKFYPDTGATLSDRAYSMQAGFSAGPFGGKVKYSSFGQHFSSFGNPYAEAAKNEFELRPEFTGIKGLSATGYTAVYKVLTDSADGSSYKAGLSFSLSPGPPCTRLSSLYLSADYNIRPYLGYKYQCRSGSINLSLKLRQLRLSPLYSYSASQSDRLTQSHTAGLTADYGSAGDVWLAGAGYQYYEIQDNLCSTNQRKHTFQAKISLALTESLVLELGGKQTDKTDRIDSSKSYRQWMAWTLLNYRF